MPSKSKDSWILYAGLSKKARRMFARPDVSAFARASDELLVVG